MRTLSCCAVVLSLIVAVAQADSAQAVVLNIADYQSDFQGVSPDTGWRYMTNFGGGTIGTPANYSNLLWYAPDSQYNLDGAGSNPRAGIAYVNFGLGGSGHPGPGTPQVGIDTFAIAAYTIQAADLAGYVTPTAFSLTNTSLNAGGGSIELRVYVQPYLSPTSTLIGSADVVPANSSLNFNRALGNLSVGDTIYVGVGPNGDHSNDGFNSFDFTIQANAELVPPAPEPSTALLLGLGMAGLSSVRRRKVRS